MLILGDRYQITKEEEQELLKQFKYIHKIDVKNLDDKEIIKTIKSFLVKKEVDFIVLNLDKQLSLKIKVYLEEIEQKGIKIYIFSEFCEIFLNRKIIEFNENNLDVYKLLYKNRLNNFFKRIFDIFFSIFAIFITFPFMFIIGMLIKIKSPNGDIFFTQERLGLNGRIFKVIKFRTMVPNAEKILEEMLEQDKELKQTYLKYRKLKNDPRIIKGIGNFLRKTSLDELPQFFNILKGDMSVVGPRPYIKEEFYNHDPKFLDIILSVRPGITGLWQVGDRNDTTFNNRVKQDIEYILNQSLLLDIKIIIKTVWIMISNKGAY